MWGALRCGERSWRMRTGLGLRMGLAMDTGRIGVGFWSQEEMSCLAWHLQTR